MEKWGFKFHGPVEGDGLFQYVTLPDGWKKVETDHAMWSHLVDDKGRKRASIFYKAAFYDRSAHLRLEGRFSLCCDYDRMYKTGEVVATVKDGEKIVHTTKVRVCSGKRDGSDYKITEAATQDARDWLNKNYPEWDNPTKYWE